MMRVRVDFYMDEFGKLWLMQTDKLFIRQRRKVPTEGNTLLADYILRQMRKIEKREKELAREREEEEAANGARLELARQRSQLTDEDRPQKTGPMSDKSFFIKKHPHYFRSDMDEKSKKLHALELSFLEGANVKHDAKPASETRDLM